MTATLHAPPTVLRLHAQTAADLMASNPISLRAEATIEEAMHLFAEKGITAAPVIDAGGRPIGVISRSDLFIHQVEEARRHRPEYFFNPDTDTAARPVELTAESQAATVADLMTPAVFSVAPDAHVSRVVSDMVGLRVHRLFVVDDAGVLVGVITAMDVLKHLQP
jgi:predicted transcriptional regulator